jgi:para-nitrobenzyl esterase
MQPQARVTGGVVRGQHAEDSTVFRGIPFASLPDRFGEPGPVASWVGVRDALDFGPPPPQSGSLGRAQQAAADDWLTVNVWSADLRGRRPVLVWVHGGAYTFGASLLPEYDGAALARDGVVLVTFNYRVGLEGFGQLPGAVPNRGLLDQVAALRWVQDNIGAFGGDPGQVTVFGQSAGAGSIAALMVMPRAQGLFHRAIVQSMPGTYFTPALAADIARACADELGVRPEHLASLDPRALPRALDAVTHRLPEHAERWGLPAHAGVLVAPVVDGDVLPCLPWSGLTGQIDLLVGHTRHEQRLLTALTGQLGQITPELAARTAVLFAPDPQRYRAAFPDPEELFEVVRSDWLFRMPSVALADAQLAAGGAAYLYELTWPAPGIGGALGACHGLDVPLAFGNLTVGQPALLIGSDTGEAEQVSGQMRAAWCAFAATGDPGWADHRSGATMLFDVPSAVVPYPEQISRDIWRQPPEVLDLQ